MIGTAKILVTCFLGKNTISPLNETLFIDEVK
jgi:hypothetical protein